MYFILTLFCLVRRRSKLNFFRIVFDVHFSRRPLFFSAFFEFPWVWPLSPSLRWSLPWIPSNDGDDVLVVVVEEEEDDDLCMLS